MAFTYIVADHHNILASAGFSMANTCDSYVALTAKHKYNQRFLNKLYLIVVQLSHTEVELVHKL